MPRLDRNVDINAPINKVFEVINDTSLRVKWNLPANEVTEIEPGKYYVKTTIGEFITIRKETVENKRVTVETDGGPFERYGYILKPKGNITNVTVWGEFDDESKEKMLLSAGLVLLKCLKKYVEYIEEGGDPDKFDKKKAMKEP
jgi:hypothetical protein